MKTKEKCVTRVLHQEERYKSDIEYRAYGFPSEVLSLTPDDFGRPLTVTLMEKTYAKNNNLNCYFELTDDKLGEHKIILTTTPLRNYKPIHSNIDMRKVPLGTTMTITLGEGKHEYIVWLRATLKK